MKRHFPKIQGMLINWLQRYAPPRMSQYIIGLLEDISFLFIPYFKVISFQSRIL